MDLDALSREESQATAHWEIYGQRGQRPPHRVAPWHWKNHPFVMPASDTWRVLMDSDQVAVLLLGFVPVPIESLTPPSEHFVPGETTVTYIMPGVVTEGNPPPTEDKWFVYSEGPNHKGEVRVHMHRSLSGYKQVELLIDAGFEARGIRDEIASIKEITWETDPRRALKGMNFEMAKEVAREVSERVLNVLLDPRDTYAVFEKLLNNQS
ncbi:hypothetical protein QQZ08_008185 [Neonectria magnoliae]|uniref:Uncharacterized protein n=1 Tax=Neonectria magnoliae TaxID=2732573 RepID=A0ABR1HVK3_9HYPO